MAIFLSHILFFLLFLSLLPRLDSQKVQGYSSWLSSFFKRRSETLPTKVAAPPSEPSLPKYPIRFNESDSNKVFVHLPSYGTLSGRRLPSKQRSASSSSFNSPRSTKFIDTFLGIPYAKAPIGPYRFSPPQRLPPWGSDEFSSSSSSSTSSVYDARHYGPECWQPVSPPPLNSSSPSLSRNMDEDCLYLNVFVPVISSTPPPNGLPVQVYLHGGAFQQGGSNRPESSSFSPPPPPLLPS